MPSQFGQNVKPHAHSNASSDGGALSSTTTLLDTTLLQTVISLWTQIAG